MAERRRTGVRLIYLAPILAMIALAAWAIASPVGASPDDDHHLVSIWCANGANTAACEPGVDSSTRRAPAVLAEEPCFARSSIESGACQDAQLARGEGEKILTDRGNFVGSYPPVYYATMSVFVGEDIAASVVLMRLVNILLFVALTSAIFAALPRPLRLPLIVSWAITTVPLGLFLITSNNPSAWAIIGVGSSWISLIGYFGSAGRRSVVLGTVFAVSALMASGSRADAASYIGLVVVIVLAFTFTRGRTWLLKALLPFMMTLIAVFFFLNSRQSASGTSGFSGSADSGPSGDQVDRTTLLLSNIRSLPQLWVGVFGSSDLGWFDTPMPTLVVFTAALSFATVGFIGLSRLFARKIASITVLATVLVLLPLYVLYRGSDFVGQLVQSRYLLPLMVVLAGFLLLTPARRELRFSRAQVIVVISLLSLGQIVALHSTMRRFITGTDAGGLNLDNGIEWWWDIPISPMFVLAIGSLAYTALLVVLALELSGRRYASATEPDGVTSLRASR